MKKYDIKELEKLGEMLSKIEFFTWFDHNN